MYGKRALPGAIMRHDRYNRWLAGAIAEGVIGAPDNGRILGLQRCLLRVKDQCYFSFDDKAEVKGVGLLHVGVRCM